MTSRGAACAVVGTETRTSAVTIRPRANRAGPTRAVRRAHSRRAGRAEDAAGWSRDGITRPPPHSRANPPCGPLWDKLDVCATTGQWTTPQFRSAHPWQVSAACIWPGTNRRWNSRGSLTGRWSARTVDVSTVPDAHDDDLAWVVSEPVEHPVGAASGRPDPREIAAQGLADPAWPLNERSGEEIDHGPGDRLGQNVGQRPAGRWGEDELVLVVVGQRRRARTASTPRSTSPRA